MNHNQEHLDEAISALSKAVSAVEEQIGRIDDSQAGLRAARQEYLTNTVETLIPEVSQAVLAVLEREARGFVTAPIRQAFSSGKKFLGLFATKSYNQNLEMLRVRLASHLDQVGYGNLHLFDDDAKRLAAEKQALQLKVSQTLEMINLLRQAKQSRAVLPQPVVEQVQRIVDVTRRKRVPSGGVQYSRSTDQSRYNYTVAPHQESDFDLYYYLMTDIPISARTLLIDAISDSTRLRAVDTETSSGARSYDPDNSSNDNSGGHHVDHAPAPGFGGVAAGVVAGGAAVVAGHVASEMAPSVAPDGTVIATDDSLGTFS